MLSDSKDKQYREMVDDYTRREEEFKRLTEEAITKLKDKLKKEKKQGEKLA